MKPVSYLESMLDVAEQSLYRMRKIIEIEKENDSELRPFFDNTLDRIQYWLDDVTEAKKEHKVIIQKWNDTSEDSIYDKMVHTKKIRKALDRLSQLNTLLTYCDSRKIQREHAYLQNNQSFATNLIRSLLARVRLDIIPIVVFSNGTFAYDEGTSCIFTIPYSFFNSYDRWTNISHEVGHLFIRRMCDLDTEKLAEILIGQLREETVGKTPDEVTSTLGNLMNWVGHWAEEIACDCVALFLSGISYINEAVMYSFLDMFSSGSRTHPPTDFRLACLVEIAERIGVDVKNLDHFRNLQNQIANDPINQQLTSMNLVPKIIDWIWEHECISGLVSNWSPILDAISAYSKGNTPDTDLDIAFAALSYLSGMMSTEKLFEELMERTIN